ncbi:MAG TPA: sulfite dehydrogenase [Bryobacteraceae bacterium]|nr:sulfite dehydrogenase [Bryobacteraceae bacterium]
MTLSSTRRRFLEATSALTGLLAGCKRAVSPEEEGPRRIGRPLRGYGERSPYEKALRELPTTKIMEVGQSYTPLAELCGIITPSELHYERHHAGVPEIDPAEHRLLIHGMVERPLIFTVDDLKRLPSVSRICFLECSGNSHLGWGTHESPTVQLSHGLVSCSEWTGVSLALLLGEVGVQPGAKWILAEGADACKMQRSVPLEKALDDAMVAYGQNGEALRPEQGYPLRLLLPGWEGNSNVKWLRRLKLVDQPQMTRDETAKYTDPMPDGTARQFTFVMEAKSVVTFPSGGQKLAGPGFYEITGLAWSGRGRIDRVEVSTDGGSTWTDAQLQEPRLKIALTRFRLPWRWDGREAVVQSRATDETGYVQPTREELIVVRGLNSEYHNNTIRPWKVMADGSVTHVVA